MLFKRFFKVELAACHDEHLRATTVYRNKIYSIKAITVITLIGLSSGSR
jgi:hypothetical protein